MSTTVAHASGSEFRVIPYLMLLLPPFSVFLPLSYSVFFRVIPWLMLLFLPFPVSFRGKCFFFRLFPWQMLLLPPFSVLIRG